MLACMTYRSNLLDIAIKYNEALPARIRQYLNGRGVPDYLINSHLLGWNGWRITIPIYSREGKVVFFRLAKDPQDTSLSPKMLSASGASVELYGWEHLASPIQSIVICEGEFDRLVLEAQGFAAITSTAGAATFRPQWAQALKNVREVYVCFDHDQAGQNGMKVVGLLIPSVKIVTLPEEVGTGGDVTDYFVRLKHSREDFLQLLSEAKIFQSPTDSLPSLPPMAMSTAKDVNQVPRHQAEQIKNTIPIAEVIKQYVELRPLGDRFVGCCPFHTDQVPSLTVYPITQTFYCFGCRTYGDVIAFVQKAEKLSFTQTIEILKKYALHPNDSKHSSSSSEQQAA
jgi:DNA primase